MTSDKQEKTGMKSHRDLIVWQKSMSFVEEIYNLTKSFPPEEKYGLAAQLRRASVSIPSNISEGAARQGKKEFRQFLYMALGTLLKWKNSLNSPNDYTLFPILISTVNSTQ